MSDASAESIDIERRQWLAGAGGERPSRILPADDTLGADAALRAVSQGQALLWRGDFHNARQLLDALVRRLDARGTAARARAGSAAPGPGQADRFHRWRMAQAQRAHQLSRLLIPLDPGWVVPLRRAPDIRVAAAQAFGELSGAAMLPLRALLGAIGAHQWRLRGIGLPVLAGGADTADAPRIHPHYGVFAPVRNEYLDLLAEALTKLPAPPASAFDLGTGTGVIAILLARHGIGRIVATDSQPRALACAAENIERFALTRRIALQALDDDAGPYPAGRASLLVCNPPWLPGKPVSLLEHGVFDPGERMLGAFLAGVDTHLSPGGEAWLLMSDLAERLGLRAPGALAARIAAAGLRVLGRTEIHARHAKSRDADDPLAFARGAEIVSLWRLAPIA